MIKYANKFIIIHNHIGYCVVGDHAIELKCRQQQQQQHTKKKPHNKLYFN